MEERETQTERERDTVRESEREREVGEVLRRLIVIRKS